MTRMTYRVSCKAALFNLDRTKVLLVEYLENEFGLPGGHLEEGELPEEAVGRELFEELGIRLDTQLERKDFWLHPDGKVILGFVGALDETTRFSIDTNEIRATRWTSIEDIRDHIITAGTYDEFILKFTIS